MGKRLDGGGGGLFEVGCEGACEKTRFFLGSRMGLGSGQYGLRGEGGEGRHAWC